MQLFQYLKYLLHLCNVGNNLGFFSLIEEKKTEALDNNTIANWNANNAFLQVLPPFSL